MKIGYFTDLHLRENVEGPSPAARRMSRLMRKRLEDCVETFRREKVDLIVCTGDLIDDETEPGVHEDLALIQSILFSGQSACSNSTAADTPVIVIPGNHDPYPGMFYEVIREPEFETLIDRYQILAFPDYCEPGTLTSARPLDSITRMEKALLERPTEVDRTLTLQHYVIYPDNLKGYPYNYENADAIREAMEKAQEPIFSISGHYHRGLGPTEYNRVLYFAGKAMCEEPFPCYVIELVGKNVRVRQIDWPANNVTSLAF